MTKRIFRAICTAALVVFLVTIVLTLGVVYEYFSNEQMNQLRVETTLAARGVALSGRDYFTQLDGQQCRLTWISADGTVLYDTSSDSGSMENHMEREEIREAIDSGHGESSRYSSTLMQRSLYCAQRLADGSVIRLSVSHRSVLLLVIAMLQPILIIMLIAVLLAFGLASRLTKRIIRPMNRIDLDRPLDNKDYAELFPLLNRINTQQAQLRLQAATLRQKQNELDAIVGNVQEGMALLDQDGRIITINATAQSLLDIHAGAGAALPELTGDEALLKAVRQALSGKSCSLRTVLKERIMQISAAPVFAEEAISGAAVVFFDITQQELAEQQRREFTANVSHELKTPLHAISGYSELIKCGMAAAEDVQPFAEKIYGQTQRLISLVEDIISLSRLDEGGKELTFTRVDLLETAREVADSLADLATQSQVRLTVTGTGSTLQAVPELVRTMIYNLCDNAIKYNRSGGSVELRVDRHRLTVQDTGIGIPKQHLERIFERFYRVDKGRSKQVGGTGLGLSIVKHAAQIHKAEVSVDSTVGEGTTITVTFPEGPDETA